MSSLKVRMESLPARCEICHQSDCFDPQINQCSRCSAWDGSEVAITKEKRPFDYSDIGLMCGLTCGALGGMLMGLSKSTSIETSLSWVIIGLAMVGAIWGAIIGAGLKQLYHQTSKE